MRLQRGEGIVRNARARRAEPAQQRGLARVRQAHDAHIRKHLELKPQPQPLPRLSSLRDPRCAVGRALEMRIPIAAPTTPGNHQRLSILAQIDQSLRLLPAHCRDDRAHRQLQQHRRARPPTALIRPCRAIPPQLGSGAGGGSAEACSTARWQPRSHRRRGRRGRRPARLGARTSRAETKPPRGRPRRPRPQSPRCQSCHRVYERP